MTVDKKSPVNLNIMSFKFPPPALVSIAHRISGVLLFILTPIFLYVLSSALSSADHFSAFVILMHPACTLCHLGVRLVVWIGLLALIYHILAGIRHLVMDIGLADSYQAAKVTAILVMVLFILAVFFVGAWLW